MGPRDVPVPGEVDVPSLDRRGACIDEPLESRSWVIYKLRDRWMRGRQILPSIAVHLLPSSDVPRFTQPTSPHQHGALPVSGSGFFELAASLFEPSEARNQLRSRVGLVSPCTSLWAAGHALLPHPPRWTVSRFARRHTAGLDRRLHSRRRESGMRRPDSLPSGQSHPVAALLCHLRTPRYLGARHAARLLAPSRLGCFRFRTHASLRGGLATRGARYNTRSCRCEVNDEAVNACHHRCHTRRHGHMPPPDTLLYGET